ncbi:MAG TPA: DUF362 domain-containing protein [Smithella sp.]|nr:DUF362 domain-containing protein [Smithella sp.]
MFRRFFRYLTRPSVLRRIAFDGQAKARIVGRRLNDGLIFKSLSENTPANLNKLCQSIVPAWDRNEQILVKINLNTADAYPASTDPEFLTALLCAFKDKGYQNLLVGDCSSIGALPTRKAASHTGIAKAVTGVAKLVCFDNEPWIRVHTGGKYLPSAVVPKMVFDVDRIIHLANLKTHVLADFSFGMKLGVGYMHPLERRELHREYLQEKVAELAFALQPDLTVIDGRQAFICGGPSKGRVEKAGIVLWGENPLAVDVEAYRRLYALKKKFNCLEGFTEEPFEMRQLRHARQLDAGNFNLRGYKIVEA